MGISWQKSTCPYCGYGCGVLVGMEEGKITQIKGLPDHPANFGKLCMLMLHYPPIFYDTHRLKYPLKRTNSELEFERISWDTAEKTISQDLLRIMKEYGPQAIAFYGGAINLTEEYYLMNKLMKGMIGSNNLECSTRICMASTAVGFISTFGLDAPPTCYEDIEEADLFFIAGINMAVSNSVLFNRILTAKRNNNAKIIVVDPRRTQTAKRADLHLQILPGTDVYLNNTIVHLLFENRFVDEKTLPLYASGLQELKNHVAECTAEWGALKTHCSAADIVAVANLIGTSKRMITIWLQGYNHSTDAVFKNNTLHNISILTDNIGKKGVGPLSITGEANALGNRWVGALSHLLPGMRMISNYKHRKDIADIWDVPAEKISGVPGKSILEIIEGLHSGEIKALWIMTTNPAVSLPNSTWVRGGLKKAELLIVQDIVHPTATTEFADFILPAAQWCEKEGTFISSERRIELVEKFIDPPGEAKPDCEIIWNIAKAMGYESYFPYRTPEDVFKEIQLSFKGRLCDLSGVDYDRLRGQIGVQLPCPTKDHPGTKRLFLNREFPRPDGRAALLSRTSSSSYEVPSMDYPFILNTGRISSQFNSGTRTGCCPALNKLGTSGYIEISPSDAEELEIHNRDRVEVSSLRGKIILPARISPSLLQGTAFIPWNFGKDLASGADISVNLLTKNIFDVHSKQPAYKYTTIALRKI